MIGDLKEENNPKTIQQENHSSELNEISKSINDNSYDDNKSERDSINENQIFAIFKEKRQYKCDNCGKLFKENGNLKTHLRLHSGVKPYICKYQNCGKRFVTLGNLKSHEFNHTENKPFKCIVEGCGKFYSRHCRLEIHIRTHYDLKPYKCPYENCDKSFNEKGNLKTHVRIHTGEKPFACDFPECGMAFKAHGHLKDHKKRHTNYRPYKCHLCDNSFARSSTLKIHLHTHQGDKPHKCPFPNCNKNFTERGNMKTHYKNHLEQRKTLEDLENPQEMLKNKKLRLAAFKENPFKKLNEEEKKIPIIKLENFELNENSKNENLNFLKKIENLKSIIEKQEKEISESTKTQTHKLKPNNPNLIKGLNRKRQKVKVTPLVEEKSNNFSFNNIAKNSFIFPSNYNDNNNKMLLSLSEIASKNSDKSNLKEDKNKLNFSFSEAVELAANNKLKEDLINNSSINNNSLDDLNKFCKTNQSFNENINGINKEKSVFESINFKNKSKFTQGINTEFTLFDKALENNVSQFPLNTFNFSNISNSGLNNNNQCNKNNFQCNKINETNKIATNLKLEKENNQNNEESNLDYSFNNNINSNNVLKNNELFDFSKLSSFKANSNLNSYINNDTTDKNDINNNKQLFNKEENMQNFSNLSNVNEIKSNFNNIIISNNSNAFNTNIITNTNNINDYKNRYLSKKIKLNSLSIKSHNQTIKDDNELFLKPKDVSTPIAHLERLLNENAKEESNNFGKLINLKANSNANLTTLISNQSQSLKNNKNNNPNLENYKDNNSKNTNNINNIINANSLTNSTSSGKNNHTNNAEIKNNSNNNFNINLNQNLNDKFQGLFNSNNSNISNFKHQPVFNFNQISSFNFIKNPIEQRGTPANLNTISSIHSNNLERNNSANVNFELLNKNYGNINGNYSSFNGCVNNQNNNNFNLNTNPLANSNNANSANQNFISNFANLNSLYSLNNLINTVNYDRNNYINMISQSSGNLNINNSANSINSPKNLICNLMPNLQEPTNIRIPSNNIALTTLNSKTNQTENLTNKASYAINNQNLDNNSLSNIAPINIGSLNNQNIGKNNPDYFNFNNLSSGLNIGLASNVPHCIGSTPISQQNNFVNALNNAVTPPAGNGLLNLSEIYKYRSQINADYNNNLSLANSSILNYNIGNNTSINLNNNAFNTSSLNANINSNNLNMDINADLTSTPISALRKHINDFNFANSFKANEHELEAEGERTNRSLRSSKSNHVNIDEVNQMYNILISKLQMIKVAKPDYYNECCENYKNFIKDSEKRIYIILKIISDYERLYPDDCSSKRDILSNYINYFHNNKSNQTTNDSLNNLINNNLVNESNFDVINNNNNYNRNSSAVYKGASNIKIDDFSSKNFNTHTNMNSTNNVTTCKSSPWLNAGKINSFGDLAVSYFKKLNNNNKISYAGNEDNTNRNVNYQNLNIVVSPTNQFNNRDENLLNYQNYADNIVKDTSPFNYANSQLLNLMTNQLNLSNICSPVSLTENNTDRIIQNHQTNRVRNQPTFSDFVKNIPNNFNQ